MARWVCFDGSAHPVSGRFLAIVPEALSGASEVSVEAERHSILSVTHGRLVAEATADERMRLRALDHVLNLNRALRWLDGRDYRAADLFGTAGTLDQVHGNLWHPDTCGCRLSFLFDHWKREDPQSLEFYPHHFGALACDRHARLGNSFEAHFEEVLAENRLKNLAEAALQGRGRFGGNGRGQ